MKKSLLTSLSFLSLLCVTSPVAAVTCPSGTTLVFSGTEHAVSSAYGFTVDEACNGAIHGARKTARDTLSTNMAFRQATCFAGYQFIKGSIIDGDCVNTEYHADGHVYTTSIISDSGDDTRQDYACCAP